MSAMARSLVGFLDGPDDDDVYTIHVSPPAACRAFYLRVRLKQVAIVSLASCHILRWKKLQKKSHWVHRGPQLVRLKTSSMVPRASAELIEILGVSSCSG